MTMQSVGLPSALAEIGSDATVTLVLRFQKKNESKSGRDVHVNHDTYNSCGLQTES